MKNPRLVEMSGRKFGEWIVIGKSGNKPDGAATWLCRCSCGIERIVVGGDLRRGKSVSCGCKGSRATIGARSATHRMNGSRIHTCWSNMLSRCRNKTNLAYGGKGIAVCQEWTAFEPFYAWAMSSGYTDELTIERRDNRIGYNPDNCTWATRKQQARNRTIVNMNPEGISWAEVAEMHGVPVCILNNRVASGGWSFEKAATTPVGSERSVPKKDETTGRFIKGGQ